MTRCLPRALAALIAVIALGSPAARADTGEARQAAADVLFQEAKQRMSAGDYASACPKLAEAQRLDPTAGTVLNLGLCYELWGKPASALGAYGEAEALAHKGGDTVRRGEAARKVEAMSAQAPRLMITVAAAGRESVTVKRDGAVVPAALWGTGIPVDPGEYGIEASAPGKKTWSGKATVGSAPGTMLVSIPELATASAEAKIEPPPSGFHGQRTLGIAVGAVGIAGVVAGSIAGALALSKNGDSQAHCTRGEPDRCDAAGLALRGDARTAANISNVAFAIGGAGLVAGVVLVVTAPSSTASALRLKIAPAMAWSSGGLSMSGQW